MNETKTTKMTLKNNNNNNNNNNTQIEKDSSQYYSQNDKLYYQRGFGNHFESEAVPNTLPQHRNNPKQCPGKLYAEQLSGTAFTCTRSSNRRTWLYRMQPSVSGTSFPLKEREGEGRFFGKCDWSSDLMMDPNPLRWFPLPLPGEIGDRDRESGIAGKVDFVDGMYTMAGCGDPMTKSGMAIHVYSCNANMRFTDSSDSNDSSNTFNSMHLYNSDGDFLIVPQHGSLDIQTELGKLIVHPKEICIIPRGMVFSVNILESPENENENENENEATSTSTSTLFARGYILELFKGHFHLPELGPIGSNGLANARDFLAPTAHYDTPTDQSSKSKHTHTILNKFGNTLFQRSNPHNPYNVIAWHGNYVPYKYDLHHFCCINSVTYDHPDPSIYTVLTAPSHTDDAGTALADFVVFPPRVLATDSHTFRPPWFHRNCMSEFMGLISGTYDAKKGDGFVPGGASLHNCMTPHGPDLDTFQKATAADCSHTARIDAGSFAFMFETCCMLKVTSFALEARHRDLEYAKCWDGLENQFDPDCVLDCDADEKNEERRKKRSKTEM